MAARHSLAGRQSYQDRQSRLRMTDEPIIGWHGLWLPADLPDGECQILMNLYDPETLERMPVCRPSGNSLPKAWLRIESGIAQLLDLPGE